MSKRKSAIVVPSIDTSPQRQPASPGYPRWAGYALAVLLVVVPLMLLPEVLPCANETGHRLAWLLCAGLLGAVLLWSWAQRGCISWRGHALDVPVGLFAAAAVLCALLGAYPRMSFFGALWTYEYGTLPLLLLGVLSYVLVKEVVRDGAAVRRFTVLLVSVGVVVGVVGWLDFLCHLGLSPFSGVRLAGTLESSMFAGTYFAMLIPPALALALDAATPRGRWLGLAAGGFFALSLAFTLARAAYIGLLLTLIILGALFVYYRKCARTTPPGTPAKYTFPLVAGGIVVLLAIICAVPMVRQRVLSVGNLESDTVQTRFVYMRGAEAMFQARPLQGWGPGNYTNVSPEFRPSSAIKEQNVLLNRGYVAGLPHNIFLQVAAEMGLLGLVPFVLLWVVFARTLLAALRGAPSAPWLTLGLGGLVLANLLTNLFAFDNSVTQVVCWCGLGLLAASSARTGREQLIPLKLPQRRLLGVAGLALAVVVLAGVIDLSIAGWYMQHGLADLDRLTASKSMNDATARHLCDQAISEMHSSIALLPLPDNSVYHNLFLAYYDRLDHTTNAGERDTINTGMVNAGQQALHYMNRDYQVLRFLSLQYICDGQPSAARPLLTDLVTFEPNSGEVRLLYSIALAQDGDPLAAESQIRQAITLNPTTAEYYYYLAHYQFLQMTQQLARTPPRDICANYAQALQMGAKLPESNRLEFAELLLLAGDTPRATQMAETLRGTASYQQFQAFLGGK